jgi:hypothetical protein
MGSSGVEEANRRLRKAQRELEKEMNGPLSDENEEKEKNKWKI